MTEIKVGDKVEARVCTYSMDGDKYSWPWKKAKVTKIVESIIHPGVYITTVKFIGGGEANIRGRGENLRLMEKVSDEG